MSAFVKVGKVADFPERRGRVVVVDGAAVAVFRRGSRFVAVADTCPHMRASLSDGRFDGTHVECALHGWKFDILTGRSQSRTGATVRVYEARVAGGDVFVKRREGDAPPGNGSDGPVPGSRDA